MMEWKSISTNSLPPLGEEILIILDDSYSGQYRIAAMERMEEETGHEFAFMIDCTYCHLLSEVIAWCEIPEFPERLMILHRKGKSDERHKNP